MPARGDRNAPRFDPTKPRELTLFFSDLEYHFARIPITDEQKQKDHARRYVDCDTSDLWESLPEYNVTITYEDYKTAIRILYPSANKEHKWSMSDLTSLTEKYAQGGITCSDTFRDYHQQFLIISIFLVTKGRLQLGEQSCAFIKGFSPTLWPHVLQ